MMNTPHNHSKTVFLQPTNDQTQFRTNLATSLHPFFRLPFLAVSNTNETAPPVPLYTIYTRQSLLPYLICVETAIYSYNIAPNLASVYSKKIGRTTVRLRF